MAAIHVVRGDIFQAKTAAVVNAVNTVGVMGKGLALSFRERFPGMYASYREACAEAQLKLGGLHVYRFQEGEAPWNWAINFPTKGHWKDNSQMVDVERGLVALARFIREQKVTSVAIPALGCGLGGLPWVEVRDLILTWHGKSNLECEVWLYQPTELGVAIEMKGGLGHVA